MRLLQCLYRLPGNLLAATKHLDSDFWAHFELANLARGWLCAGRRHELTCPCETEADVAVVADTAGSCAEDGGLAGVETGFGDEEGEGVARRRRRRL